MESFRELYELVKSKLREELSETIFDVWLRDMEPISFEDGVAILALPGLKRKVTEQKFMAQIHRAFESALGFDVDVRLVEPDVNARAATPQSESPDTENESTRPLGSRLPQGHEANTFETFVIGGSNKFAHAAAIAVASNPGKLYNPLFIHGNSGLGKTHLLSAIYHEFKSTAPRMNIIFTSGEAFTNEMIRYLAMKSMEEFHQKYRSADMLLVDDVQFIERKEATQEEFFHTFNALTQNGNQIVLTSDKPPKDMIILEDRLRSRFDAGLIADIQPPDLETRMAFVKRKADDTGFAVTDEIVDFIARQLKSNIRQLEGAVNRLEALVTLRSMPLNMNTAQHAIADIVSEERPLPVTIERIVEETARTFQLSAADLRSKRRSADISHARHIAMYVISQMTGQPTKAIGSEFDRDHSTVVYALGEIRKEIQRDSGLRKIVNEITKVVQEG
ncbi:MAG: chromosomal replication initiator protein DnaA [Oscillospiraceae bacterium]|jgi:chromosomal replication initiator protein|nr:chromosomal replication initiator protein DnaA [Oscillospiraceae bacterium]